MSSASTSNDSQSPEHHDDVFALRDRVRKYAERANNREDDETETENDDDGNDSSGSMIITPAILESTIVPAMKELLKQQDESKRKNVAEEKKDAGETPGKSREDDVDNSGKNRLEYTTAILECLVSFVAVTCAPPPPQESTTQQSSYNSLSFRRTSTPKKTKASRTQSKFSMDPKEGKDLFVRCGAFAMAISLLQKVLDHHVNKASSSMWSRNKRADLDTFDSIGVADSSADVKIESTKPENDIPALVMQLVACLAHNASDAIKTETVLPLLATIVHKSMMVFLPSAEVQAYGCWTLYSLSNPLLQELIAAGSVSVLVRAMKCHHSDARVQEHGSRSLYNLLPLLAKARTSDSGTKDTNPMRQNPALAQIRVEIDGEQLEDYSSLLPGLPAIVLRGMEFHPQNLAIQQYGLLVMMRLCKLEQEFYEVIISDGGLKAILQVVTMATTAKLSLQASEYDPSEYDDPFGSNDKQGTPEKYDCLVQMACQFLRDISRPTNSSMDILRIIAVKGGIKTVLKLLDHYNQENLRCGGGNSGMVNYYGKNQRFAIINIIDPAMACLRNLMTNEDNRQEVATFMSMVKTMEQEQQLSSVTNPYGDDDDGILVSANIMLIVIKTMDTHPLDAPIQAYGCDLLGRLAQGQQTARMELIQTTIYPDAFSSNGRSSRDVSLLQKKAGSPEDPTIKQGLGDFGSDSMEGDDSEIVDLSDQMNASVISMSSKYRKNVDAFETTIRAMRNHPQHMGVQERSVTLILAMVVDRDATISRNGVTSVSQSHASYYLIQRLQQVYEHQKEKDNPETFLSFLQSTAVPPKGIARMRALIKFVDEYDRKTNQAADHQGNSPDNGPMGKIIRRWNMLAGGGQQQ